MAIVKSKVDQLTPATPGEMLVALECLASHMQAAIWDLEATGLYSPHLNASRFFAIVLERQLSQLTAELN